MIDYIVIFVFGFLTGLAFYLFHYTIFMIIRTILKSFKNERLRRKEDTMPPSLVT